MSVHKWQALSDSLLLTYSSIYAMANIKRPKTHCDLCGAPCSGGFDDKTSEIRSSVMSCVPWTRMCMHVLYSQPQKFTDRAVSSILATLPPSPAMTAALYVQKASLFKSMVCLLSNCAQRFFTFLFLHALWKPWQRLYISLMSLHRHSGRCRS